MATERGSGRRRRLATLVLGGLLVGGVALAGVGAYLHLTIAGEVQAGRCDGCAPWHPLFVVAPLVFGTAIAVSAGYLLSRR